MNLHSNGQDDFIKELNKKKQKEISALDELNMSDYEKATLIQKIKARFNQLIKDSDQSLFVKQ